MKKLITKIINQLCTRFLPVYIKLWSTDYLVAIWSAPVRYAGCSGLSARHDTAWEALRITIRHHDHELVKVIKYGRV